MSGRASRGGEDAIAGSGPIKPLETSVATSQRMRRQKSRNTQVEVDLRKRLHRAGMRYRVHHRPVPGMRREADVAFTAARVAVFVDGCFWHGCPEHATWPKTNAEFWREKIEGNRRRDANTDSRLAAAGWLVVRVWEHEGVDAAAARIQRAVEARRSTQKPVK